MNPQNNKQIKAFGVYLLLTRTESVTVDASFLLKLMESVVKTQRCCLICISQPGGVILSINLIAQPLHDN